MGDNIHNKKDSEDLKPPPLLYPVTLPQDPKATGQLNVD